MAPIRVVVDRLYNRKRVSVTPRNYLKRCKLFMLLHFVFMSAVIGLLFWILGITVLSIAITLAIAFISISSFAYFAKKTKSVAVKGDTLILNSFDKRSCVTSLRSIKNVHTSSLLGIQLTRLNYKLDGLTRSTVVINRSWAVPSTPEQLIKKAIQLSKKKKANHKPGSVSQ